MTQTSDSTANWPLLATSLPGPDSFSAVTDADAALLTPAQILDAISCTERLLSHVAGLQITLLTEFAKPGRAGDITRIVDTLTDLGGAARTTNGSLDSDLLDAFVTDHAHGMAAAEVAAALNISPITARGRVEKAVELHDELPATHQALTNGLIDRGRAAIIAEHTDILDPETRSQVEGIVLPLAQGRTAGRLRPLIDRAVIIADPEAADRRVKKARKGREVTHRPLKDQLSIIKAILPAEGAVMVFNLIDLLAGKRVRGDDRFVGERRADALSDLCKELLTHGLIDLRGLLAAALDPDDSDQMGDLLDDDEPVSEAADDFDDLFDSPNGPVTSNNDWYDDVKTVPVPVPAPVPAPDVDATTTPSSINEVAVLDAETAKSMVNVGVASDTAGADGGEVSGAAASAPVKPATVPSSPNDSRRLLRRQGRRPHLTLTMSMSTLMALDRLPGHLDGYGAITAELADAIMDCAASLNLVIIDPATGHPLHASGRQYYRPRQHHRDIAGTMAETCRFPSCRQPVWKCDLDHRKAYDHRDPELGGPTDSCNLDPLCRRHHLMKHHSDWSAQRQPDGTMKWTSPTQHTYDDPPREITLPGELLTPTPNPRTSIGLADSEHQSQCAAANIQAKERPGVLSHSYAIRLADREELHQRVLQRLANLRRQQIAEMDSSSSASTRKVTDGFCCLNDETLGTSHSNLDSDSTFESDQNCSNHQHSRYEHSTTDPIDFDDHPAWTTANIPKTVAELRARSGYTTALADDDSPPF